MPVWGTAESGKQVTVEFAGQKVSATAGADGKWRAGLQPMEASAESRTFTVTGSKTAQPVKLDDVLVGEVWLASGQSNMTFPVSKIHAAYAGVANEAQEIAAANYPLIRMFTGQSTKSYTPQEISAANGWSARPKPCRIFRPWDICLRATCKRKSKCPWASSPRRLAPARLKRGSAARRWPPIRK